MKTDESGGNRLRTDKSERNKTFIATGFSLWIEKQNTQRALAQNTYARYRNKKKN